MKRFAIIIWLILLFAGLDAQNYRGGSLFRIGDSNIYCAAVRTEHFVNHVAAQRGSNWCWAACVQMVLNYQGVDVSQEKIVRKIYGDLKDLPGTADQIVRGANGWVTNGHRIVARQDDYMAGAMSLVEDLAYKYPVIVGLSMPGQTVGHAYVMTGITFADVNGICRPQKVILRNPAPWLNSKSSREELSWYEFSNRVHTIVHVYPSN